MQSATSVHGSVESWAAQHLRSVSFCAWRSFNISVIRREAGSRMEETSTGCLDVRRCGHMQAGPLLSVRELCHIRLSQLTSTGKLSVQRAAQRRCKASTAGAAVRTHCKLTTDGPATLRGRCVATRNPTSQPHSCCIRGEAKRGETITCTTLSLTKACIRDPQQHSNALPIPGRLHRTQSDD